MSVGKTEVKKCCVIKYWKSMRVLQSMSTNYLILLFDITVEAATGGGVELTLQLSISSPKQLKKTI